MGQGEYEHLSDASNPSGENTRAIVGTPLPPWPLLTPSTLLPHTLPCTQSYQVVLHKQTLSVGLEEVVQTGVEEEHGGVSKCNKTHFLHRAMEVYKELRFPQKAAEPEHRIQAFHREGGNIEC